ncbi:MAG: GerMN domain-containing protein [Oscillospiraceae bacterium]|jgi:germination protein M
MKKLFSCILALAVALSGCGTPKSASCADCSVYYLRKTAYQTDGELLTPVQLTLPDGADAIHGAVEALSKKPESDRLQSPLPDGVSITDAKLADGVVSVGLSEGYLDAAPLDQSILKSALTLTLCSVAQVRAVSIHVGSETVEGRLTAEDIILTNTVISAKKAQVRLYFPRVNENTLGCEYRTITTDDDNSAERRILEAILAGPEEPALRRAFPVGTVISSVYTQDGVCTVSLSGLTPNETGRTKTDGELAVYAAVDSLTALAGVKSVQIILDGQQSTSLWGFDISRPLTRNEELF